MAFTKGTSGNAAGRPPGTTAAGKVRQAIEKQSTEILATVIQNAIDGDTQAAKILLDRLCPQLKPQALPVIVPLGDTLPETGSNIIFAMATGTIPPDIASQLIKALSDQSKMIETWELSERLSRLEVQLKIQNA